MSKKIVKREIKDDKKAKIIQDQHGEDHLLVIEEKTFYTFTNLRRGPMFFTREDGKEDMMKGKETRNDITERERVILLKSKDYENGWIVEEKEKIESEKEILNKNAINEENLLILSKKYKGNWKKFEKLIDDMDSEFAVSRLREFFIENDLPSSLVVYCDYRLQQINEAYQESQRAPIDKEEE
ncbi:MAG: hypothetical protein ACTSR4_03490 [Candidatus Hodarchaeales archaeon]